MKSQEGSVASFGCHLPLGLEWQLHDAKQQYLASVKLIILILPLACRDLLQCLCRC